ncbi:MAG TPA: hypothetical protein PLP41_03735 [Treponemataceae bacterium]|mgnify:CR=1 FL=1|nr:hypothetical protein [Treponemataceae bacterium]HOS34230.1 hypothetical protein [Treponemataceae bacterium]HPL90668.1 hypothetical protein [Treponemataceae bacterium]
MPYYEVMNGMQVSDSIRILEITRNEADRFSREFPDDDSADATFSRWSAADVLHHLTAWLAYSRERLTAILDSGPTQNIDDLEAFNREAWEGGLPLSRGEISQHFADEVDRYRDTVTRFTDADFNRTDLPTGFDWPLWKYILLDTAVHPGWHFVYHGITRGNFKFAVAALDTLAPAMLKFSGGDESVFDLSELADDPAGLSAACASFAAACPDNTRVQALVRKNQG